MKISKKWPIVALSIIKAFYCQNFMKIEQGIAEISLSQDFNPLKRFSVKNIILKFYIKYILFACMSPTFEGENAKKKTNAGLLLSYSTTLLYIWSILVLITLVIQLDLEIKMNKSNTHVISKVNFD